MSTFTMQASSYATSTWRANWLGDPMAAKRDGVGAALGLRELHVLCAWSGKRRREEGRAGRRKQASTTKPRSEVHANSFHKQRTGSCRDIFDTVT